MSAAEPLETEPPETDPNRRPIRARSTGWASVLTRALIRIGASPNGISVAGLVAACVAGAAFWGTSQSAELAPWLFVAGGVCVQMRLLCNLFDGMDAVTTGTASPVGELYNEVPDRLSDAAILIGFGYAAGGFVELGYVAAAVAIFVAYVRAMVRNAGAPSDFCGPLAKPQRMAVVTIAAFAAALLPGPLVLDLGMPALALVVVASGGALTATRRLLRAASALRGIDA